MTGEALPGYSEPGGVSRWDDATRTPVLGVVTSNPGVTVREIVEQVRKVEPDPAKVASVVRRLEDEGAIELSEECVPLTLAEYATSPQSLWFQESLMGVENSLHPLILPTLLPSYVILVNLRYTFASILVLFLPGYALMAAAYPIMSPFGDAAKFAVSLGISLAVGILIVVPLSLSPLGLGTGTNSASVAALTLVMLMVALNRRYNYRHVMPKIYS